MHSVSQAAWYILFYDSLTATLKGIGFDTLEVVKVIYKVTKSTENGKFVTYYILLLLVYT